VIDRTRAADRPIFDEDDSDLADNQEFDRALAAGNEALSQGNPADARIALEKSLRYKPRNQRARNLLGLSLFKLGELAKAEEIYRALIEATAFGTRLIVETFQRAGVPVESVRASGGLTANELLVQIYADVIGLPLEICSSPLASAIGAAMLGAVAGGAHPDVAAAAAAMAPALSKTVAPDPGRRAVYDALYAEYVRLVDYFGRAEDSPLKRVRALREQSGL